MPAMHDIVIIGNGVLGLSLALELAQKAPSLNIAVLGPSRRSGAATTAAGAMLGCFGEITANSIKSSEGRQVLNYAIAANSAWPKWLKLINEALSPIEQINIHPGTFVILNTETGKYESENYNSIIQSLNLHKQKFQDVDPSDIPGMDPSDRCRPLKAIYMPDEGYVNPVQLLFGLSKACEKHGVKIIDDSAVDFELSKSKMQCVKTKKGEQLHAGRVVLAAGAYTQKLLDKIPDIKQRIPKILSGTGCGLILRNSYHRDVPIKHVIRSPNRGGACGIHILPYSELDDTLFYMGASNSVGLLPKTEPKVRDLHYLTKRAIEQFNQNIHQFDVVKQCVGNRPMSIDGFPLIGNTSIEGLSVLTGTYRTGIHLSPVLAKLMSKEILENKPACANFSPERLPIETLNKQEAIDEFVRQWSGVGAEHGMELPHIGWHEMLQDMISKRTEALYNELQTDRGIHPDILIMLEMNQKLIPIFREYYKSIEKQSKRSPTSKESMGEM